MLGITSPQLPAISAPTPSNVHGYDISISAIHFLSWFISLCLFPFVLCLYVTCLFLLQFPMCLHVSNACMFPPHLDPICATLDFLTCIYRSLVCHVCFLSLYIKFELLSTHVELKFSSLLLLVSLSGNYP